MSASFHVEVAASGEQASPAAAAVWASCAGLLPSAAVAHAA